MIDVTGVFAERGFWQTVYDEKNTQVVGAVVANVILDRYKGWVELHNTNTTLEFPVKIFLAAPAWADPARNADLIVAKVMC